MSPELCLSNASLTSLSAGRLFCCLSTVHVPSHNILILLGHGCTASVRSLYPSQQTTTAGTRTVMVVVREVVVEEEADAEWEKGRLTRTRFEFASVSLVSRRSCFKAPALGGRNLTAWKID